MADASVPKNSTHIRDQALERAWELALEAEAELLHDPPRAAAIAAVSEAWGTIAVAGVTLQQARKMSSSG